MIYYILPPAGLYCSVGHYDSGLLSLWFKTVIEVYLLWLLCPDRVMGCGAAEATGLDFVCFIVINPCVLSTNRVDLGSFCIINFPIFLPPPPCFYFFLELCFLLGG